MKKLLHERLREVQASTGLLLCNLLVETLGIPREKTNICTNRVPAIAEAIADEIEKYYIPRPRFEDGEPVQFGDSFIQKCVNVEVELDKIGISLFTKDGLNMVWFPDEVVPRPEPKVLDADGVEIKVGDTVFENNSPIPLKVVTVYGDGDISAVGDGGICSKLDTSNYSHREPDSLEKLRDDIAEFSADGAYHGAIDAFLQRCEDRLTAIMERDA